MGAEGKTTDLFIHSHDIAYFPVTSTRTEDTYIKALDSRDAWCSGIWAWHYYCMAHLWTCTVVLVDSGMTLNEPSSLDVR